LAFQETFKELIVKKEDSITERKEMWCRDKEATAKRFFDLQERSIT
jgi:hypothetical protein